MTIDEAIEGLKTERQLSVDNMDIYDSEESRRDTIYYVSILETAIDTMRKYQKIQEIVNSKTTRLSYELGFRQIRKVVEDGSENNHHASDS